MPMNGRINGQLVVHEDLNVISFVNFNQRARLLAIDKIDVATNAVWALSVEMSQTDRDVRLTWSILPAMECKIIRS